MMRNSNVKRTKKPDEISCVQLSEGTKQKLSELGKRGDTFESIILGLVQNSSGENEMGESQDEDE